MSAKRQAVANYVADMSAELAQIAHEQGLELAAYMLEMAASEAASVTAEADNANKPLRVVAA